eukprot:tig00000194_g14776.t1
MAPAEAEAPRAAAASPSAKADDAPASSLDKVSFGLSTAAGLVGLSVFVRLATFVTNILIARVVGPAVYGLAQVQFQFMLAFVMQISKEGVRRATSTVSLSREECYKGTNQMRSIVNLAWGGMGISGVAAVTMGLIFLGNHRYEEDSDLSAASFWHATVIYAAAAVLETSAEPAFTLAQARAQQHLRVSAEAFATVARCISTVLFLRSRIAPLVALAGAQAVYGAFLSISLSFRVLQSNALQLKAILPSFHVDAVDPPLLSLAGTFCLQSIFRFGLSEGERAVLSFSKITELIHRGEYALVNNLGSLGVRMLLQPVEEAAAITFAKLYAGKWTADAQAAAAMFLQVLLKTGLLLGISAVAIGYNSAGFVITTLYGSKWSTGDASVLLGDFCLLFGLLAVNGVMEAFLSSTSSPSQLRKFLMWHASVSVVYLVSCFFVVPVVGMRGLFWSNGLCMLCRILFAWFISRRYLEGSSISFAACIPSLSFLLASAITFLLSSLVNATSSPLIGIPVVGGCGALQVACILLFERKLMGDMRRLWRKEKIV